MARAGGAKTRENLRSHARGPDRQALVLAAAVTAEGHYPERVIAEALGISRRTLVRWKSRPDVRLALDVQYLLWQRGFYRDLSAATPPRDLGPLIHPPARHRTR